MRILVCVKRVPAPGARIVLTDDGQQIDSRNLSFTTSPHEECAVEEALRLVEARGGSATVLTLGPVEADEQLRYALSVGIDDAVLMATEADDWDAQATAAALASAVERIEATSAAFDLILFGNESADSGGYQVGIRVARALRRPVVSGIKRIEVGDGDVKLFRETSAGFEAYRVPLPAVVAVREGINLPRYPTLPGRLRSKKAEITRLSPDRRPGGLAKLHLMTPPEEVSVTEILGRGAEAAPRVAAVLESIGVL